MRGDRVTVHPYWYCYVQKGMAIGCGFDVDGGGWLCLKSSSSER